MLLLYPGELYRLLGASSFHFKLLQNHWTKHLYLLCIKSLFNIVPTCMGKERRKTFFSETTEPITPKLCMNDQMMWLYKFKFFVSISYIMMETSWILNRRWWCLLCTRPTCLVQFLYCQLTEATVCGDTSRYLHPSRAHYPDFKSTGLCSYSLVLRA